MNQKKLMDRGWVVGAGCLVLALVLLGGVAGLSGLKQWRIDLTADKLYTLSAGSRHIVENLKEPVHLTFYYSEELIKEVPVLRNYARSVQDLLQEYVRLSDGQLVLNIVKPALFSEEEDAAAAAGLQGFPNGQGQSIYFGLVGDRGEQHEVVSFFNPQRESLLEYDISQLIYRVGRTKPAKVAVISGGLPIFRSMDPRTRQAKPPWAVMDQLQRVFDIVQILDINLSSVESDVDLVMLVHPRLLPDKTLYALDQFVLRGGRLLVFVDPLAELDNSEDVMGAGFTDKSSSLEKLFDAWGLSYDPKQVLLDMGYAHSIPVSQYGREVPHLGVLGFNEQAINREQNVIADLDNINVGSAGVLEPAPGAATVFVPLLSSSTQSRLMEADAYALIGTHEDLLRGFQPDNKSRVVAAWLSGAVSTAFPQGAPKIEGESVQETLPQHIAVASVPIQVIVVADTDVLADRMWADVQDFYGQKTARAFASNADMVTNMMEALTGSANLIDLRSRGTFQRPFTRVDELERTASSRLREEQDSLMASLAETEKKINDISSMQDQAGGTIDSGGALPELSAESRAAIDAFQKDKQQIRRNLREVQRQLNSDVERLGWTLKLINIAAVPVLLTIIALILSGIRIRRARRTN